MQENIGSVKQESSDSAAQIKETISDIDQRIQQDLQGFQTSIEERIAALSQTFSSNIQNISGQVESEADFNEETKAQINTLFSRIDEINEKLYEFEINKKNNLIFYGLAGENRETPSVLIMKVGLFKSLKIIKTLEWGSRPKYTKVLFFGQTESLPQQNTEKWEMYYIIIS